MLDLPNPPRARRPDLSGRSGAPRAPSRATDGSDQLVGRVRVLSAGRSPCTDLSGRAGTVRPCCPVLDVDGRSRHPVGPVLDRAGPVAVLDLDGRSVGRTDPSRVPKCAPGCAATCSGRSEPPVSLFRDRFSRAGPLDVLNPSRSGRAGPVGRAGPLDGPVLDLDPSRSGRRRPCAPRPNGSLCAAGSVLDGRVPAVLDLPGGYGICLSTHPRCLATEPLQQASLDMSRHVQSSLGMLRHAQTGSGTR